MENTEEILKILNESKGFVGIMLIVLIAFIVLLIITGKKRSKKNRERLRNEIMDYATMFNPPEPYSFSGNISYSYNGIQYSRGNKTVLFDIPIGRETTLYLSMVDEWFSGRNYNQREAIKILNDIKEYLISNGYCKTVVISEDEADDKDEYEEFWAKLFYIFGSKIILKSKNWNKYNIFSLKSEKYQKSLKNGGQ